MNSYEAENPKEGISQCRGTRCCHQGVNLYGTIMDNLVFATKYHPLTQKMTEPVNSCGPWQGKSVYRPI